LRQYNEALEALGKALSTEANSKELSTLQSQVSLMTTCPVCLNCGSDLPAPVSVAQIEAAVEEQRKRDEAQRAAVEQERSELTTLYTTLTSRGYTIGAGVAAAGYQQHADRLPVVDGSVVSMPVLFLYPQYMQSDFVEQFEYVLSPQTGARVLRLTHARPAQCAANAGRVFGHDVPGGRR
jgi:hypothetical protein